MNVFFEYRLAKIWIDYAVVKIFNAIVIYFGNFCKRKFDGFQSHPLIPPGNAKIPARIAAIRPRRTAHIPQCPQYRRLTTASVLNRPRVRPATTSPAPPHTRTAGSLRVQKKLEGGLQRAQKKSEIFPIHNTTSFQPFAVSGFIVEGLVRIRRVPSIFCNLMEFTGVC
jgi:hypothetical protein